MVDGRTRDFDRGPKQGKLDRRPQAKMSKIKIGLRLRLADRAFKDEVFSVSGNGRRNTFSQDFHEGIERDWSVKCIVQRRVL